MFVLESLVRIRINLKSQENAKKMKRDNKTINGKYDIILYYENLVKTGIIIKTKQNQKHIRKILFSQKQIIAIRAHTYRKTSFLTNVSQQKN